MIGNITKGTGFGGLFGYLLKSDKDTEILDGSAFHETPGELTEEFELVCAQNPFVTRIATHVSIAFAQEDGEIDRDAKIRIGQKVIGALGYSNSLYVMVAHGRSDPGHRQEHNHDHIHIALASVDLDGKWVDDAWNYRRLEKTLREIEIEEGLRQVPSSWEAKRSAPKSGQRQRFDREMADKGEAALPVSDRLQARIYEAATSSASVSEFAQKLAHQGIESRLNITRTGKLRGISYQMEGVSFQGSQLYDASLPKLQSVHGLTMKSDDLSKLRQGMEFLRSLPLPNIAVELQNDRDDDDSVGGALGELETAKAVVESARDVADNRTGPPLLETNLEKDIKRVALKKTQKSAVIRKKSRRQGMQM